MLSYLRRIDPVKLFFFQAFVCLLTLVSIAASHFFPAVCS